MEDACDGGLAVARIWLYDIRLLVQAMTAGEWREFAHCADAERIQRICLMVWRLPTAPGRRASQSLLAAWLYARRIVAGVWKFRKS